MKHLLLVTVVILLLSNSIWAWQYRELWYEAAQAEGLEDEGVFLLRTLPDSSVYQLKRTTDGELAVHCANGGDATVRTVNEFGSIVVSCRDGGPDDKAR